jgi:hypothetical protein
MCVTLLGRPYEKYVKGDVSIRYSLKKNVSQTGLGSHRPHGTRTGLKKKLERGVHCIHLIQDRGSWLAVVDSNEPWISMKCRKFLDRLRDYLLANLYTYSISRVSI